MDAAPTPSQPPIQAAPRFEWPPRTRPAAELDLKPLNRAPASDLPTLPATHPGPTTSPAPPEPDHFIATHDSASPRLAFERTWLGLVAPPWTIRAVEAGFYPDPPSAYCPRCAGPVGPGEVPTDPTSASCASCRGTPLPWSRALRVGAFTGVLRDVILEAKYAKWRRLAFDLGTTLGAILSSQLTTAGVDPAHAALIPIPMSFRRRWSRGIDHTLAIARGVRSVTRGPILRPLRRRHRPAQAALPESGREANARGSFTPRSGENLAGFPVIVVLDDVRTTGATLRAACRALNARERRLGSQLSAEQVWVASLAVVTPTDRRAPDSLDDPDPGQAQDSYTEPDALIS